MDKSGNISNGEKTNGEMKKIEASSVRLEKLMGHGRFQLFQVWTFAALVCFVGSFNTFQLIFTVTKNPHRCSLPEHIEQNFQFEDFVEWSNLTSSCTAAAFDESCSTFNFQTPKEMYDSNCFNISNQIPCSEAYGYIHQRNAPDSFWSLSSEYDWVCDKSELGPTVMVARSVGIIISTLIFMQMSDKYGRSLVSHLTNFIYIFSNLIALFVTDHYGWFIFFTGLGSTFSPIGLRIAYTLVAEYCNDKGRSQLYISGWVLWVAGAVVLSGIAYLAKNWFVYGLVIALSNLVLVPFIWLTPESPRLLLTQGKVDESEKIIRNIIKVNKKEPPDNLREELEDIARVIKEEQNFGVHTLFKSRRLAFYTVVMSLTWIVNDFIYLASQMNVENLNGNQYINFALVSCTELPSVFVGEFLINRYGRRWSHVGCLALTTLLFSSAAIASGFEGYGTVVTVFAIMARTSSNVAWFINWVQSVEIFPTSVRVSGTNFAATMASVVTVVCPDVVLLGAFNLPGMYGIFTAVGTIGVISTLLLPETYKEPLPECLDDLENRKIHPFFSWKVWLTEDEKQNKTRKRNC